MSRASARQSEGSGQRRRLLLITGAAVASLALLAGCIAGHDAPAGRSPVPTRTSAGTGQPPSTGQPTGGAGSSEPTASPLPGPASGRLARFYQQTLDWKGCGPGFECTTLSVPMDYQHPSGRTLRLAVVRSKATDSSRRLGSLVLNPGGPGGSGVQYARAANRLVSAGVRARYDIVGFDPRGVGASDPISCLTDAQTDALIAADPSPDTSKEAAETITEGITLGRLCQQRSGSLLRHVDTRDAAHDMDILRAALGDKKLNYLGKSYGTFLGATYAGEFPENVGAFVLDGAIAPELSTDQIDRGQAKGFELATRRFMLSCLAATGCPFHGSVDSAMGQLRSFMRALDAKPLRTTDPKRPLTEGLGSSAVIAAMYDQAIWPTLEQELALALRGDGTGLEGLSDLQNQRDANGHYANNSASVIYAVNCVDRGLSGTVSTFRARATQLAKVAPTWGRLLAWSDSPCATWPVPAQGRPEKITAKGSGPILVVGTTRDPATPYPWAQSLARELSNGHLLTYVGDGHTAYRRGSSCIDSVVDAYLLTRKVPARGTSCH